MPQEKILTLDPSDNVGVALGDLSKGTQWTVGDQVIVIREHVGFGHKIALRMIAKGEVIKKYGAPIGLSTCTIEAGGHVHTHNMESMYMKQFTK